MLKQRKTRAYKTDYHAQDLAFAPLACNSFDQQGSDLLRYLWLIADRHSQRTCSGLVPSSVFPFPDAHCSASASVSAFKACRARLYRQLVHEVLIAIYEAVTERVLGRTYAFQAYPSIGLSFSLRFHLGLPFCPPCLCRPQTLFSPISPSPLRVPLPFPFPFSLACDRPPALVLVVLRVTVCW